MSHQEVSAASGNADLTAPAAAEGASQSNTGPAQAHSPSYSRSPSRSRSHSLVRRVVTAAERARAYLARMPVAVQGQGGHLAAFKAASTLVNGFALSEQDALPLLLEWNAQCLPPWREADLRYKLRSGRANPGGRAPGYLLDQNKARPFTAASYSSRPGRLRQRDNEMGESFPATPSPSPILELELEFQRRPQRPAARGERTRPACCLGRPAGGGLQRSPAPRHVRTRILAAGLGLGRDSPRQPGRARPLPQAVAQHAHAAPRSCVHEGYSHAPSASALQETVFRGTRKTACGTQALQPSPLALPLAAARSPSQPCPGWASLRLKHSLF